MPDSVITVLWPDHTVAKEGGRQGGRDCGREEDGTDGGKSILPLTVALDKRIGYTISLVSPMVGLKNKTANTTNTIAGVPFSVSTLSAHKNLSLRARNTMNISEVLTLRKEITVDSTTQRL